MVMLCDGFIGISTNKFVSGFYSIKIGKDMGNDSETNPSLQ
jgi:hypothetical protein